jgi:hypothetical protein
MVLQLCRYLSGVAFDQVYVLFKLYEAVQRDIHVRHCSWLEIASLGQSICNQSAAKNFVRWLLLSDCGASMV